MGINRTASDDFDADLAAFKAANNPTRAQKRKYVAALVNRGNEWLAKFDAQESTAPADFAATRQAQFNTYLETLGEPQLSTINPAD